MLSQLLNARLINTSIHRGGYSDAALPERFQPFSKGKTVETVEEDQASRFTQLKQGVNEKGYDARAAGKIAG